MSTLDEIYLEQVYWAYANKRMRLYHDKLKDPTATCGDDIIDQHRFTNCYRASDRVSQCLIRIQYASYYPQDNRELFFRTMLFKLFNKIETWDYITHSITPFPHSSELARIKRGLLHAQSQGKRLYSNAYIQASPGVTGQSKVEAHMDLLEDMLDCRLYNTIANARSLEHVYDLLSDVRSFGSFLAYQYAIDLNYSTLTDFDEDDFVVPGPGALDGISKIMPRGFNPVEAIEYMTLQGGHYMKQDLFGRPLHLIDCQNLFCEISKYTRLSHPELVGSSGRTTIKQKYKPFPAPMPKPFFPPKWQINKN
jgi:hypothetical protein